MRFSILSTAFLASVSAHVLPKRSQPAGPLVTYLPSPNDDPFYAVPPNISDYATGEVVRSRKVSTSVTGLAVNSYEIFYRTNDNMDNATGTVATIWAPAVPRSPPSLLSYQYPEDAINQACAPSWAFVNSSSTYYKFVQGDSGITIPWALSQGWYVVNPDFEGPYSAVLVGRMEAHAVLDGIRATIEYLSLSAGGAETGVALYGYSGGAHASVWASTLAESYAPELHIVGAAYGGTPPSLEDDYFALNAQLDATFAGGQMIALQTGYPELNKTLTEYTTPEGLAIVEHLRRPDFCLIANNSDQASFQYFNFSTIYTIDIFTLPIVKYVFAHESLLMNASNYPVPVPKFPRFEFHGMADTTVPYWTEAVYVEQQCAQGADIRFVSFPGLGHLQVSVGGIAGAFQFMKQAFEGTLLNVTCGSNVSVPAVGSEEAVEVYGLDVANLVAALYNLYSSKELVIA